MPSIENTTIFTGLALSALGGAFYYYTGQASITALIPTFMGAPVLVSGLVLNATENVKVKAGIAHIAVLITLVGTLAGFGMGIKGYLGDKPVTSVSEQLIMVSLIPHVFFIPHLFTTLQEGGISLYHLVASIQHFKKRKAEKLAAEKAKADHGE